MVRRRVYTRSLWVADLVDVRRELERRVSDRRCKVMCDACDARIHPGSPVRVVFTPGGTVRRHETCPEVTP